jgi:hypothetical protein
MVQIHQYTASLLLLTAATRLEATTDGAAGNAESTLSTWPFAAPSDSESLVISSLDSTIFNGCVSEPMSETKVCTLM